MSVDLERDSPLAPLVRVIPFVIGIFAMGLVVGGKILAPGNLAWLQYGDAAQHYLGWAFYRAAPWGIPVGTNPLFGLEMASSIVYSDSIPLLAIFFKLFAGSLPKDFQYFGLWVLACFVLQSWFGFRLARLMTKDITVRALLCVFFVISPPMLFRLGGHLALAGHFLILAALYGCLSEGGHRRRLAWTALVCVAALVHAYLLVMVLAIWSAGLADRMVRRATLPRQACIEATLVVGVLAFVCWQAGYFAVSGGATAWGYGFYRMNMLSPVDPDAWSRVLLDLPGGEGDGEGFGYLGVGMLCLLIVGCVGMVRRRPEIGPLLRRHRFLVLSALLMVVYAWSDQIGFGAHRIDLGYAGWLGGIQEKFRASGRFFWPAYYLMMLAAMASVVATFKPAHARWILAVCLVIQIYDTSVGWRLFQPYRAEPSSTWESQPSSAFWKVALGRYDTLRALPPSNRPEGWARFSGLAASERLGTDIVYLARINEPGLERLRARADAVLASGDFDPRTLYVLDELTVKRARDVLGERDFIAFIDGFYVLVPRGRDCQPCMEALGHVVELQGDGSVQSWSFNDGQHHEMLAEGWSGPEPWGVWTEGPQARIQLPGPAPETVRIRVSGYAYGPNAGADIVVRLGGQSGVLQLGAMPGEATLDLPNPDNSSSIELLVPKPTSPLSIGQGEDRRALGVALTSLSLQAISIH